jgi:plasmid stabilization system protein ParE
MIYRVEIARSAEADLREAYRWLQEKSPTAADQWRSRLPRKINTLASQPKRCPLAEENEEFDEELRVLLYGKRAGVYRILFTIRADSVVVLHVRHSARGPIVP